MLLGEPGRARYRGRVKKRVGLWAFVAVGVVVAAVAVATWINPTTVCRGEAMAPGDTCTYSTLTGEDAERTQTYEERIATARHQAPFGVAAGLGIAGFGGYLIAQESRLRRE